MVFDVGIRMVASVAWYGVASGEVFAISAHLGFGNYVLNAKGNGVCLFCALFGVFSDL